MGARVSAEPLPPVGSCVLGDRRRPDAARLDATLSEQGRLFACAPPPEARQGLRLARQLRPVAITLDVMMPGMDGWTVLAALKADRELRDIPVIMLTMVDDPDRGFALGAAEFRHQAGGSRTPLGNSQEIHLPASTLPGSPGRGRSATREMTRAILEKEGWKVSEAENGRVALECMERERPRLILLDLMMPEMDGFEFAARVREKAEWRSIPIVVLTACDLSTEDRRRLNGYVETIIQKSGDSREALLRQLRDFLEDYTCASRP